MSAGLKSLVSSSGPSGELSVGFCAEAWSVLEGAVVGA